MNHNKHNLKAGQTVILDKGFASESEVLILRLSNTALFSQVYTEGTNPEEYYWSVMTARLSPKPPYIPETEDEAKFLENDFNQNK